MSKHIEYNEVSKFEHIAGRTYLFNGKPFRLLRKLEPFAGCWNAQDWAELVEASASQVGGTHYTDMGIQPLEYTYANYGYIGLKAAIHTKVNKYLGRIKDDEVEQLKKARHCIDLLIEKAELL